MILSYTKNNKKFWDKITDELIKNHPLSTKIIVEEILKSWDQIFKSKIGVFSIGKQIFPSPQIMSFLLHELVGHNISLRYPKIFNAGTIKNEKDIVHKKDNFYSIEIKASSHPNQIFGNRSYAQPDSKVAIKSKNGYYIVINFEKFSRNKNNMPEILLIRFGFIEHTDWIAQNSATGQQARLKPETYKNKLRVIYEKKGKAKKE